MIAAAGLAAPWLATSLALLELALLAGWGGKKYQSPGIAAAFATVIATLLLIALVSAGQDRPLPSAAAFGIAMLSALAIGLRSRPWFIVQAGAGLTALPILLFSPTGAGAIALAVILIVLVGGWMAGRPLARRSGFRVVLAGGLISAIALIAGQSMARDAQFVVGPGQKIFFQGWTVSLHDVAAAVGPGWSGLAAEVRFVRGSKVDTLFPERRTRLRPERTDTPPITLSRFDGDLSVRLGQPRDDGDWGLLLGWRPFGSVVTFGAILALLGALAMLLRGPIRARWRARRLARAGQWWA